MILCVLAGYLTANGEPSVFSDSYLESQILEADAAGIKLEADAVIAVRYEYKMCSHDQDVLVQNTALFNGRTREEISAVYPGSEIKEFGAKRASLVCPVNGYCPAHYVIRSNAGKVAVFKTNGQTAQEEVYLETDVSLEDVKPIEKQKLALGVVFESTEAVNDYLAYINKRT